MDETSFLLPARSHPSSSSESVQPYQVLADDDDPSSSRLLEAEAPPRPRGLREIVNLFRDSIPGSSSLVVTIVVEKKTFHQ